MPEFRVYTPEGASIDLDVLIATLDKYADKAKITAESMQRAVRGTRFRMDTTAEIAIQAGMEIGFRQSSDLLKAVKAQLVAKSAA